MLKTEFKSEGEHGAALPLQLLSPSKAVSPASAWPLSQIGSPAGDGSQCMPHTLQVHCLKSFCFWLQKPWCRQQRTLPAHQWSASFVQQYRWPVPDTGTLPLRLTAPALAAALTACTGGSA